MSTWCRVAFAALAVAGASGCGSATDVAEQPVKRVLIVSLPGVAWGDVRDGRLPTLADFADGAAIGDLSTRIGRRGADNVAAYLTLGAGTRARAPRTDGGVALEPDESYRGLPAADVLERRLGFVPDGIAYLAFGAAQDRNERSPFGADVGALGDELDAAGVDRAVIANADQVEGVANDPPVDAAYSREAAVALIGSDGTVPDGAVSRRLLVEDPFAPFGQRLDLDATLAAFDRVWDRPAGDRTVVLVEASDLTRATAYRSRVTSARLTSMRRDALAAADDLLGALLERVDLDRDAVLVLSPVAPPDAPALGIAAVRAPGSSPGVLRSATTRRDGYVQLADIAPTILDLLGIDEPEAFEGRAFGVSENGEGGGRVASLADAADAAEFRDRMVAVVTIAFIGVLALLVAAVLGGDRTPPIVRAATMPLAMAVLGAVPATFLVGALDDAGTSVPVYIAVVLAVAVAVVVVGTVAERRWPGTGPVVAVMAVVVAIAGDVVAGAPLQVNTVFGYSVAVAGRFAGLGNLAFALLGSATVVAGALLADRFGLAGRRAALALLAAVLLVDGLPILGADVGGVLSMVPAFTVTALVLVGRRVGWREAAAIAVATAATVLAFAFIDLARPVEDRTHLARLAEHVIDARWGPFFDSFTRRWQASFGGAELAAWVTIAAVIVGVAAYVIVVTVRRRTELAGGAADRSEPPAPHRPTIAAASGLTVLAAVGLVANDSSFAVPATMLIVIVPALVLRLASGQLRLGRLGGEPS